MFIHAFAFIATFYDIVIVIINYIITKKAYDWSVIWNICMYVFLKINKQSSYEQISDQILVKISFRKKTKSSWRMEERKQTIKEINNLKWKTLLNIELTRTLGKKSHWQWFFTELFSCK